MVDGQTDQAEPKVNICLQVPSNEGLMWIIYLKLLLGDFWQKVLILYQLIQFCNSETQSSSLPPAGPVLTSVSASLWTAMSVSPSFPNV